MINNDCHWLCFSTAVENQCGKLLTLTRNVFRLLCMVIIPDSFYCLSQSSFAFLVFDACSSNCYTFSVHACLVFPVLQIMKFDM